jgi:hypothetical protein
MTTAPTPTPTPRPTPRPEPPSVVRTTVPRSIVVAAAAFIIAGALRMTAATELLRLSPTFAVIFYLVAAAQIGFGLALVAGNRPTPTTTVATTAMVICLVFIGSWLVVTTAMVPLYPLMNGPYPIDVVDLATAVLEAISVVALSRAIPPATRRKVVWTLVALVGAAWLIWSGIIVSHGLSN